jgi:hypothetical protein
MNDPAFITLLMVYRGETGIFATITGACEFEILQMPD